MAKQDTKEVIRSPDGTFPKGVSGNPKGRPKGTKNRIKQLKEEMELVLREGVDPETLAAILKSMTAEALNGNVQAAKLLLDKFMTNAKVETEEGEEKPAIRFIIKNLTPNDIDIEEGEIIENDEETHG